MADFEAWLDAYDAVYKSLAKIGSYSCPNCASKTLRLVFTGPPNLDVGYASFWCDSCLEGIHISRALIPDGAVVRSTEVPQEERSPHVPEYRIVW